MVKTPYLDIADKFNLFKCRHLINTRIRQKLILRMVYCRQIRRGRKPDGMCLVVGSCARGFKDNSTSDVIYSSSSVKKVGDSEVQLFWEVLDLLATLNTN